MTTVVNNPAQSENSSGSKYVIMGIVIVILALLFVYYGIPALRSMGTPQINVPAEIVVPDNIDVNINRAE